eukprot:475694-Pyramimonas_sp.AAC.1
MKRYTFVLITFYGYASIGFSGPTVSRYRRLGTPLPALQLLRVVVADANVSAARLARQVPQSASVAASSDPTWTTRAMHEPRDRISTSSCAAQLPYALPTRSKQSSQRRGRPKWAFAFDFVIEGRNYSREGCPSRRDSLRPS